RLAKAVLTYDLAAKTLTRGPIEILYEPEGWNLGHGAANHPSTVKLPNGRIICLFNTKKPGETATETGNNDISMIYSDDEGVTWSTPRIVIDILQLNRFTVNLGTSGTIQRIPEGPYAGRLVSTWYDYAARVGTLISDDDGMTWRIAWQLQDGKLPTE